MDDLVCLKQGISKAFAEKIRNSSPVIIPPEMSPLLEKLTEAIGKTDFAAIYAGIENLYALNPQGALREEIGKIKNAVQIMDYDEAEKVMRILKSSLK